MHYCVLILAWVLCRVSKESRTGLGDDLAGKVPRGSGFEPHLPTAGGHGSMFPNPSAGDVEAGG